MCFWEAHVHPPPATKTADSLATKKVPVPQLCQTRMSIIQPHRLAERLIAITKSEWVAHLSLTVRL